MFVNENTEVSRISFNFVETRTFEERLLQDQIALAEPSFWDRVKEILPLMSAGDHPFDPVVLQKDVVRLRQYYNRNGFLHPDIDYPASQLDTVDNEIHVVFKIDEGPPVIIQDVGFQGPDGSYAIYQFPEEGQDSWISFRNNVTVHTGDRYTDFDRTRIQDQALTWLKDRGYAFAQVDSDVRIDTMANTADLQFLIDTGPLAFIDSIRVEGNESVSRNVVVRELPFKPGQRFRNRRLVAGQRELFQLNLFRLALVEVPEQPRDTSVTVSVRVREAFPRYVNAQTGYGREAGATLEAQWAHRNFLGGAREFNVNLLANSGYLARIGNQETPPRLFRGSVSLRQPYLFVNRLSGIVAPFIQLESDPLLQTTTGSRRNLPLDINVREFGLNTTLIYEMLPFRTISLQHSFSRAHFLEFSQSVSGQTRDRFNKSIFSLSMVLGDTDDYVRPRRGYLIKPFAEAGGQFLASDINYVKYGAEATYRYPLLPQMALGLRLYVGRMELLAGSRYDEEALFNSAGRIVETELDKAILENRFDRIRFYAGGGNDVRGWNFRQLGPQVIRADSVFIDEDGEIQAAGVRTEALGGLAQLSGNVEMRLPFPGLGPKWSSAIFFDFGQVYQGPPNVGDLKYAVGTGLRYETLVGFIRLDVGFKLNPSLTDLNTAEDIYLFRNGLKYDSASDLPNSFMRRFAIHFSIGQAF